MRPKLCQRALLSGRSGRGQVSRVNGDDWKGIMMRHRSDCCYLSVILDLLFFHRVSDLPPRLSDFPMKPKLNLNPNPPPPPNKKEYFEISVRVIS